MNWRDIPAIGTLLFLTANGPGAASAPVDSRQSTAPTGERFAAFRALEDQADKVENIYSPLSVARDGHQMVFASGGDVYWADVRHAKAVRRLATTGKLTSPDGVHVDLGGLPIISPDGKHVAYWSNESGSRQLWVLDIATNQARQLTEQDGGVQARSQGWDDGSFDGSVASWAPDSNQIAFSHTTSRPPTVDSSQLPPWLEPARKDVPVRLYHGGHDVNPLQPILYPGQAHAYTRNIAVRESSEIYTVRLSDRRVSKVTRGPLSFYAVNWSPRGDFLIAKINDTDKPNAISAGQVDLVTLSMDGVIERVLTSDASVEESPVLSPDGTAVAFIRHEEILSYPQLCLIELTGPPRAAACRKYDVPISAISWKGNNQLLATGLAPLRSPILFIDAMTLDVSHSHSIRGEVPFVAGGVPGGPCFWAQDDPQSPARVVAGCHDRGHLTLYAAQPAFTPKVKFKSIELSWRNSQEDEVTGILYVPDAIRKPPVVFQAYPNNGTNRFVGVTARGFMTLGYAVLVINSRPPHTWMNFIGPEAYTLKGRGERGPDLLTDDVESGFNAVVALDAVDMSRVCGYGFSNGGGVLAQLISTTDKLKCAAIVSPAMVDWASPFFHGNEPGMSVLFAGGAYPWERPPLYTKLTPLYRLNEVHTPTLIIDGARAEGFILDSIALFNGLRAAHARTDLVIYPDEGHGPQGNASADMWPRILEFFDYYLNNRADSREATIPSG